MKLPVVFKLRYFTYDVMYFYMSSIQVDRKRVDAEFQTVMSVVPTMPLPPARKSSRWVSSLSQSSAKSYSDPQPGTSVEGLGHSSQEYLEQVTPVASTVDAPLEEELGFGGSMKVSDSLMLLACHLLHFLAPSLPLPTSIPSLSNPPLSIPSLSLSLPPTNLPICVQLSSGPSGGCGDTTSVTYLRFMDDSSILSV